MAEVHRTEVIAFDAEGKRVEPGTPEAVTGEATEYDADGNVLRRLYLTNDTTPDPDQWDLPDTLEALIDYLGGQQQGPDAITERLTAVTAHPSWEHAPALLQRQVYAYLAG